MKRANVFFFQSIDRPFTNSVGVGSAAVAEALRQAGYELRLVHGKHRPAAPEDFLPFPVAKRLRSVPAADLTVYDAGGLQLQPLRRRPGCPNVVLFHGMAGMPAHWLGNSAEIDQYWANSDYSRRVIESLLALPDWSRRALLEPRAFDLVVRLTLPLACLEEPGGVMVGEPLPEPVRKALASGDLYGHCLADKADLAATAAILLELNRLAQERGLRRALRRRLFRLVVWQGVFLPLRLAFEGRGPAELAPIAAGFRALGLSFEDVFVPVPIIGQEAVFELFGSCRFGLFYNWVPESFGFYPLESVVHDSKVYTNGVGNFRHLLPPGHGIDVGDPPGLGFGDLSRCAEIAAGIYRDVVEAPAAARAETLRGAALVRDLYDRRALERDLRSALARLGQPPRALDFEALVVAWSPLVRSFDAATRRIVSDYGSRQLEEREAAILQSFLGKPCRDLGHDAEEVALLEGWFESGVLALSPPDGVS